MTYSHEVEHMCVVKKGPNHGPAPYSRRRQWVKSKEIVNISGLTHGGIGVPLNKERVN